MLKRIVPHLNNPWLLLRISKVRYSALFINGHKASESFVFLKPHIDENIIKNVSLLEFELALRNYKFDLKGLQQMWLLYSELKYRKNQLENKKSELNVAISNAMKIGDNDEINKYKFHLNIVKENLKHLKESFWYAEEKAVTQSLKLPNKLHERTPKDGKNETICEHLSKPDYDKSVSEDLFFKKHNGLYLKQESALFELTSIFEFSKTLKDANFIQFSNPDFVKSLIVEGCGLNHQNPEETLILKNYNENTELDIYTHLVGGASSLSYFAYHAKNILQPHFLPIKYFCTGRQYLPNVSSKDSLICQTSAISFFIINKNDNAIDNDINSLIDIYMKLFKKYNLHFKMSYVNAKKLMAAESLKISVEMVSTSTNEYIEIANISVTDDYISKRLLLTYQEDKTMKFPKILSGTVLNVNNLLKCFTKEDLSAYLHLNTFSSANKI